MTHRAPKICRQSGCSVVVDDSGKGGYCDVHAPLAAEADRNSRDPENLKFYRSAAWRRFRKLKLAESPMCELCLKQGRHTIANTVEHIIPLKMAPDLALSLDDTMALCSSCHNRFGSRVGRGQYKSF